MKAIAFAIICAAYLNVAKAEIDGLSDGEKAVHAVVFLICITGFWICIIREPWK